MDVDFDVGTKCEMSGGKLWGVQLAFFIVNGLRFGLALLWIVPFGYFKQRYECGL